MKKNLQNKHQSLEVLLKRQVNKLPISRLVLTNCLTPSKITRDASLYISIIPFRTRSYFPSPLYKNISREVSISIDEDI